MRKPAKRTHSAVGTAVTSASKATPSAKSENGTTDKDGKNCTVKKAERSAELCFKVTGTFKKTFKQTAKELGLKKSALLEKLLAEWRERHPPVTAGAATPATDSSALKRRERAAEPTRRGTTALRRS